MIRKALNSGDYGIYGQPCVAVERKSLPDLWMCLGSGRRRFERALGRLSKLRWPAVLVEAPPSVLYDDYAYIYTRRGNKLATSRIGGKTARGSIVAWMRDYRVPFLFAGDRYHAEVYLVTWLDAMWRQLQREAKR